MVREDAAQDRKLGWVSVAQTYRNHLRCMLIPGDRLGKGKKLSVDFGTLGKVFMPESPRGPSEKSGLSSMVPSVVVSRFVLFGVSMQGIRYR